MSEEKGSDVAAEVAGQKFSITNIRDANTAATVATFIGICLIGYALWEHKLDARAQNLSAKEERKEDRREMIAVLKEMATNEKERTVQQKITNCLIERPGPRTVADCERMAR